MCSYRATSTIKPFFSVLVRSQDYNVSGIKNIEKVKIAPAPKESKLKKIRKETMDKYVSVVMMILYQ